MKKVSFFIALSVCTLFTMTSCMKTYHCECPDGNGGTTKSASVKYKKDAADTAKSTCEYGGVCKWVQE